MDEILLATLVGVLCGADDWDVVEFLAREYLPWLKRFLPFKCGIPQAQTFRKVFRLIKPDILESRFASWIASLQEFVRGVTAVDGKRLARLQDGARRERRPSPSFGLRLRGRSSDRATRGGREKQRNQGNPRALGDAGD